MSVNEVNHPADNTFIEGERHDSLGDERQRSPSRGQKSFHLDTPAPRFGCIALFAFSFALLSDLIDACC
jgi:hypothetical protein